MYHRTAECCTSSKAPRWKTRGGSQIFLLIAIFNFLTIVENSWAMPSRETTSIEKVLAIRVANYRENREPVDEDEEYPIPSRLPENRFPERGEDSSRERNRGGYRPSVSSHRREPEINQRNNFLATPESSCEGKTFCEETISPYPNEHIRSLISTNPNLNILAGVDTLVDVNSRWGPSDGEAVCVSESKTVYPKTAMNNEKEWLYILQDEKSGYLQGVGIEHCGGEKMDGTCNIIQSQITGYRTSCKQKYVSRVLAALSKNGTDIKEKFAMPSSCCCQIIITADSRFGGGGLRSDQSPAPRFPSKRRQRVNN